ncbi:hypothetical protein [Nonomuraea basaltis]|uniref:hypothetical protein n=1 Tax=Nonomuraea basaltis TaxID=2495887 RepID=UPI00110C436D|nr:hypothetical protein [Nonomuraea basaltis]TMS00290.1 hypothetical protein EJK15_02575 [Nonomuraea basaltis]
MLYVAGEFVESLEPWPPVSPFHQALQGDPMGGGLPASSAVALVFIAVSLPLFDRRDLATIS